MNLIFKCKYLSILRIEKKNPIGHTLRSKRYCIVYCYADLIETHLNKGK